MVVIGVVVVTAVVKVVARRLESGVVQSYESCSCQSLIGMARSVATPIRATAHRPM